MGHWQHPNLEIGMDGHIAMACILGKVNLSWSHKTMSFANAIIAAATTVNKQQKLSPPNEV